MNDIKHKASAYVVWRFRSIGSHQWVGRIENGNLTEATHLYQVFTSIHRVNKCVSYIHILEYIIA